LIVYIVDKLIICSIHISGYFRLPLEELTRNVFNKTTEVILNEIVLAISTISNNEFINL